MNECNFGSNLDSFIEKFGFSTPLLSEKSDKSLSPLTSTSNEVTAYQTLGGSDAIYIPPEESETELSLREELFHIEQLRSHASGYHLENLKRNFVNVVNVYIKNGLEKHVKPLEILSQRFTEYKFYNESARLPLEFQVRVRLSFYLGLLGHTCLDDKVVHFLLDKMAGVGLPFSSWKSLNLKEEHIKPRLPQTLYQINVKELVNLCERDFWIQDQGYKIEGKPVNEFSITKLLLNYWNKVTDVFSVFEKRITDPLQALRFIILEQDLLEFPSFNALNPPFFPTHCGFMAEAHIKWNPRSRFIAFLKAMKKVSKDELICLIDENLSETRSVILTNIIDLFHESFTNSDLEEVANGKKLIRDYRRVGIDKFKKSYPSLPNINDLKVISTLRPIETVPLNWTKEGIINDSQEPSLTIRKEKSTYGVTVSNYDRVGQQFLKELELLLKGIKFLNQTNISEKVNVERGFRENPYGTIYPYPY